MDQELIEPTISLSEAVSQPWDVAVVGSGPAGAMAARECARGGLKTLLLDRKDFPRSKTCGGCLNRATLAQLALVGLDALPAELGAHPINRFRLAAMGAEASMELPGGMAVSRRSFDAGLVRAAIRAGAGFLPRTSASEAGSELHHRIVLLKSGHGSGLARARLVIAADGLRGGFTGGLTQIASVTGADAYIGLGTCVKEQNGYPPGIIHMATHRHGYVGLVRVENGLLNLAGALDPRWLHRIGSPSEAIGEVLSGVGWPIPGELTLARFQGTPSLNTCRSPVAVGRVLLIGDAAGYLEPFTGEGIAWALLGGRAAAALACSALDSDDCGDMAARWQVAYKAMVVKRQRTCGLLARWLRQPLLLGLGVRILAIAPILSRPLINALNSTSDKSISLTILACLASNAVKLGNFLRLG